MQANEVAAQAHAQAEAMEAAGASWPSWHYDVGRSVYWYLCPHHLAYFIQTCAPLGIITVPSNNGEMDGYQGNSRCICEQSFSMAPCHFEEYEGHSVPSCPVAESGPSLSPGWVEDFLIECYLGGTFSTGESERPKKELCMDNGISEDPALHDSYAVNVETPWDMQTLSCDNKALCSQASLQEIGNDCLHRSGGKEGFEEATEEDKISLEAWQAQYGQVVRSKEEAQLCPHAINLWNWNTFLLKGSKSSICLRGQLTPTPSRLHPSAQHHKGFMKTTRVCEVNLDLVKVSSGEIYRLRQPSAKYLSSVAVYDSSNPTKDWNVPCFSLSGGEDIEGHTDCVSEIASKPSLIAKPFVPNLNHERYQNPNKRKVALPAIPASVRALSREELTLIEERKQKYRDRAKERREAHGVDAEYARHHHNEQELSSLAKNTNSGCKKKHKRHLNAQHMLERMGWCEGEGLGKRKDGLKEPLNEMGNRGRAGIGWFP